MKKRQGHIRQMNLTARTLLIVAVQQYLKTNIIVQAVGQKLLVEAVHN